MSRLTIALQLHALGNLKVADMAREDMVDAAMFRRRVQVDGIDSINDKEIERIAAIYAQYFE